MTESHPESYRSLSRKRYDETFMRHAVELSLQPGRNVRAVARELGVTQSMLYRWRERYAGVPANPAQSIGHRSIAEAEAEIRRLQMELYRMQERESVLKKSLGILSETPGSGMPRSKH